VFRKPRQIQEFVSLSVLAQDPVRDQLLEVYWGGRQLDEFEERLIGRVGHRSRSGANVGVRRIPAEKETTSASLRHWPLAHRSGFRPA
jgi:hypothetical protein